jgi:hypothetical protein
MAICWNAVGYEITGLFSYLENYKNYAKSDHANQSRISF